jgi:hypothetical protein
MAEQRAWIAPKAGDVTIQATFCQACCFDMEAGEGIYTEDGGYHAARHAGACPAPLTVREVAAAAGVGPRSKRVEARAGDGMRVRFDCSRSESVLVLLSRFDLNRMPPGARKRRCATVARALLKAMTTARLDPGTTLRINLEYTPWQVCALVARIARDCHEAQLGGICDEWICRNHVSL